MGLIRYLMRKFVGEKKILTGTGSFKDAAKSGRHITVTDKANVSKVREIMESNGRYMINDTEKAVGISLSPVHFILSCILKVQKISARLNLQI